MKYSKIGLILASLGVAVLTVFTLKVGFNIPPADNTAAVISSLNNTNTTLKSGTSTPVSKMVYLLGGFDGSSLHYRNDVFVSHDGQAWKLVSPQVDTPTNKWKPRFDFGGSNTIYFNNKIWVIGGIDTSNPVPYTSDVWSSPDGINWTLVSSSAPFSQMHSVVVFNNKMWIISGDTTHSKVYSSPDGITWTLMSTVPWGNRIWSSVVVFQNKIWVMGGDTVNTSKNDIWSSPDGINWIHVDTNTSQVGLQDAPWDAREMHTSLVFNNKIWIFGGCKQLPNNGGCGGNLKDVWSSPDGINWTMVLADAPWADHHSLGFPSFPDNRHHHSSFVLNDKMFIIDGDAPTLTCGIPGACSPNAETWSSPDGAHWTSVGQIGDPISPRNGLSTVVTP